MLMLMRVLTRHSQDFDIHTVTVDLGKSPYADIPGYDYVLKVTEFYRKLGIRSAIWGTPESEPLLCLETGKEFEYVLEVDESRVVAYVDEPIWSAYLAGSRDTFEYSTKPRDYQDTSVIIPTPIKKDEVKGIRRYRRTNGPGSFELAEEKML